MKTSSTMLLLTLFAFLAVVPLALADCDTDGGWDSFPGPLRSCGDDDDRNNDRSDRSDQSDRSDRSDQSDQNDDQDKDKKPKTPPRREPDSPIDPDRDLQEAGFDLKRIPGEKVILPSQTTWFDMEDDGCIPASESAECNTCLRSAGVQNDVDNSACSRDHEQSMQDCRSGSSASALELSACLDDADDDYDACIVEADDAYSEAEAECEAGACFGDC